MPRLFISYRREDSRATAGRIYDHLVEAFGASNVFIDVEAIPPGVDFRQYLTDLIQSCDATLVIIGQHWVTAADSRGRKRLDDPGDFVRMEIETALAHGTLVIPVLVDDALMPYPDDLPASLRDLVYRNAATVRYAEFRRDLAALIDRVEKQLRRPAHAVSHRRGSTWTWGAVVALLVIVAAVIAFIVLNDGDDPGSGGITNTPRPSLSAVTDTPEPTATPGSPIGQGCQYAQPVPPVSVGDLAEVTTAGIGLSLRESPALTAALVRKLSSSVQLHILDGPRCAQGYRWWSVQVVEDGRTGWVGDSDTDDFWLRRVNSLVQ